MNPPGATLPVLEARARLLARLPAPAAPADLLTAVEFQIAEERYALEHIWVKEVCALKTFTPLPRAPRFLLGVTTLRGRIVPVLDLRRFFDLPEGGLTDLNRMIVVGRENADIGILADSVVGLRAISASSLGEALPTLTGIRKDYLRGIAADGLILLDGGKLCANTQLLLPDQTEKVTLGGES